MFLLGLQSLVFSQYTLTVETSDAVGTGGTVYRFYVNMQDATDRMSAVFGNDQAHLLVNASDGVFNSTFNSSWSASGINPAFLPVFPELADDTYATIGLEGPASTSGIAGAADPSIVEDSTQPITPFFLTNEATNLESSTLTGASWYVLNTAANGLPDADGRVLIMQITTEGPISGQVNYQVFPLGVGQDQVQISMPFDGAGTFGAGGGNACGCTDEAATNCYSNAQYDDGSCEYAEVNVTFQVDMNQYSEGYAYGGVFINGSFNGWCGACNPMDDSDADGIWTITLPLMAGTIEYKFTLDGWNYQEEFAGGESCTSTIDGFTNRSLTFDAETVLDAVCWESCDVCPDIDDVLGCMDPSANNYNADATVEPENSCLYDVTLSVDASQTDFTSMSLAGTFNGWNNASNFMDDSDGDGTYTITVSMTAGAQEYKFIGNGDWAYAESFDGS